jgi:hypothetical protein
MLGIAVAAVVAAAAFPAVAPASDMAAPVARRPAAATVASTTGGWYRLVQYPQAGYDGIHGQTAAAEKSIDMEIYELADTAEENALASAAARGVTVRVLLDSAFRGTTVNQGAYDWLTSHGVQVRWAPTAVIFHIKATTFDHATSDVSTANLTSTYYATSRDAEIIDTNPDQVAAIEGTFDNDWDLGASDRPESSTVQAPGLVWSPNTGTGNAETVMVAQIASARRSVWFTSEELADPAVTDALTSAARRGVDCRIVMTDKPKWQAARCWGNNAGGQLGNGTTTDRNVPVAVSGLGSGVAAISGGGNHTRAVTTAGPAECWGSNRNGQLGNASMANSNTEAALI